MRIDISPTLCEAYRQYCLYGDNEDYPHVTFDKLLDRMRRVETQSIQFQIGTAAHLLIEQGIEPYTDHETESVVVPVAGYPDPVVFSMDAAQTIHSVRLALNGAVFEKRMYMEIEQEGYTACLTGYVDAAKGLTIFDHKTSAYGFKMDKYVDSLQWQFYLFMGNAARFRYNFIKYGQLKSGIISRAEISHMDVFPYPGMYENVKLWAERTCQFILNYDITERIRR